MQVIRDAKSGKIKPKTLYSRIFIEDLTAQDFMTVANNYFIGNNPDDMQSPEHIETVIYFYQRAKQLFLQKNKATEAARCQKRIEFYQQQLPQSSAPDQQDLETKQLLEKYSNFVFKFLSHSNKIINFFLPTVLKSSVMVQILA